MELLIGNLAGDVRREKLQGREYLVVPLTMIVPGVLNGSKGPLLYPAGEIERSADSWNHMPIVVNHPEDKDGTPLSARDPQVLQKHGIGLVLHTHMSDDSKLKAEGWFDVENTKRVNPHIYDQLQQGKQIELSTGLFTDNESHEGNWKGKPYEYVARNYRPDHLAILPNQKGACSIEDGCGVLVNSVDPIEAALAILNADQTETVLNQARSILANSNPYRAANGQYTTADGVGEGSGKGKDKAEGKKRNKGRVGASITPGGSDNHPDYSDEFGHIAQPAGDKGFDEHAKHLDEFGHVEPLFPELAKTGSEEDTKDIKSEVTQKIDEPQYTDMTDEHFDPEREHTTNPPAQAPEPIAPVEKGVEISHKGIKEELDKRTEADLDRELKSIHQKVAEHQARAAAVPIGHRVKKWLQDFFTANETLEKARAILNSNPEGCNQYKACSQAADKASSEVKDHPLGAAMGHFKASQAHASAAKVAAKAMGLGSYTAKRHRLAAQDHQRQYESLR